MDYLYPLPSVDPDSAPLVSIAVNPTWIPLLLTAVSELTNRQLWDGEEADIDLFLQRLALLEQLIAQAAP